MAGIEPDLAHPLIRRWLGIRAVAPDLPHADALSDR